MIPPAILSVLQERCKGELDRIAAKEQATGWPSKRHPFSLGTYNEVRKMAADAAQQLKKLHN